MRVEKVSRDYAIKKVSRKGKVNNDEKRKNKVFKSKKREIVETSFKEQLEHYM
jgi:hypothetical protein